MKNGPESKADEMQGSVQIRSHRNADFHLLTPAVHFEMYPKTALQLNSGVSFRMIGFFFGICA